jgi:hypothetical protein
VRFFIRINPLRAIVYIAEWAKVKEIETDGQRVHFILTTGVAALFWFDIPLLLWYSYGKMLKK